MFNLIYKDNLLSQIIHRHRDQERSSNLDNVLGCIGKWIGDLRVNQHTRVKFLIKVRIALNIRKHIWLKVDLAGLGLTCLSRGPAEVCGFFQDAKILSTSSLAMN